MASSKDVSPGGASGFITTTCRKPLSPASCESMAAAIMGMARRTARAADSRSKNAPFMKPPLDFASSRIQQAACPRFLKELICILVYGPLHRYSRGTNPRRPETKHQPGKLFPCYCIQYSQENRRLITANIVLG